MGSGCLSFLRLRAACGGEEKSPPARVLSAVCARLYAFVAGATLLPPSTSCERLFASALGKKETKGR
jgi:hypothetical protein